MKPGLKSTELYTSQLTSGGLLALAIDERDWRVKAAALIALGLIQAAYALSRGMTKAPTP